MTTTAPLATSRCPIARSLAVLGEKWTLLVVREAMWGRTRFAEFRTNLGIAPDVLADRLQTLVDGGILQRRAYREEGQREREEYVLTDAGRDLLPALAALGTWGNQHRPSPTRGSSAYVEIATGRPVQLAFVNEAGRRLELDEVAAVPA
jgi:DNA-binding HxlR family transcriptional regulator